MLLLHSACCCYAMPRCWTISLFREIYRTENDGMSSSVLVRYLPSYIIIVENAAHQIPFHMQKYGRFNPLLAMGSHVIFVIPAK